MTELPILLPDGFSSIVSVGDIIKAKQPLATKKKSEPTVTITIADELGIPVSKAGQTIKKNPGDTIEPGDAIAVRSGFLGMGEQKVLSSVRGKILSYERRTSELTIQVGEDTESTPEDQSFLSPIDGTVTVCDNNKIVIETEKNAIIPEKTIGGSIQAELYKIQSDSDTIVPLHLISPDIIGKIILAPELDRDGILKSIAIDASGLIVQRLNEVDERYLTEKEIAFPIAQVTKEDYLKIAKWSKKQVYLDAEKKSIVLLEV